MVSYRYFLLSAILLILHVQPGYSDERLFPTLEFSVISRAEYRTGIPLAARRLDWVHYRTPMFRRKRLEDNRFIGFLGLENLEETQQDLNQLRRRMTRVSSGRTNFIWRVNYRDMQNYRISIRITRIGKNPNRSRR